MKTALKPINTAELFSRQNRAYEDKLLLSDIVPANSTKLGKVSVSTLGHFKCYQIGGHFETQRLITKSDLSTVIVDDGINHLRGQLEDSTGNRKLMNDFIPLNLWLSPGRVIAINSVPDNAYNVTLDSDGVTIKAGPCAPSNSLFYIIPFNYMFSSNSDILFNVINNSNTPLSYELLFFGKRIIDTKSVR
jgi:hypothetical protein